MAAVGASQLAKLAIYTKGRGNLKSLILDFQSTSAVNGLLRQKGGLRVDRSMWAQGRAFVRATRGDESVPAAPTSWRSQLFAGLGAAISRLIAQPTALFEAVSGTTLSSISRRQYAKLIAQLSVFSYLVGFTVDWNVNVLLAVLACGSIASVCLSPGEGARLHRSPILHLLVLFFLSLGLSVLFSQDMSRSLQLSAPLLPAILIFFLIYEYFVDARDLRYLYICITIVALGLAIVLVWTALANAGGRPRGWIAEAGVPILIVPNDVALLAIIAPLSLALVYLQPRSAVAILAWISMALSLCVATVYLSRTATLTFLAGTICTAAVRRAPRYVFVILIGVFLAAGIDYLSGHALATKFLDVRFDPGSGRLHHLAPAWAMFLDAPVFGHGLHTYDNGAGMPWAHNLYLQSLAEQGVVGLLALLLLLSYAMVAGWKAARSPVREQRILAAGALGALVGFCAASIVELTLLREWVVVVIFVLLAVVARVSSLTRED